MPSRPPPGRCATASGPSRRPRSTGHRSPSSATTAPTRQCPGRPLGDNPRDVAAPPQAELERDLGGSDRARPSRVAGPGFVNLYLSDAWYRRALADLVAAGDGLGPAPTPDPEGVLVEFVSANPTGPLHVGGGRHAAYGDALVRLLQAAGHEVEREYYVNDAGGQIDRFAESIAARMAGAEPPEDGYAASTWPSWRRDRRRGDRPRTTSPRSAGAGWS